MDLDNVESPQDLLDAPIMLPLEVDLRYNVAICTQCRTGLAFDHIQGHLRGVHGIRKQLGAVMEYLNIEAATLSSAEIKDWISKVWILDRAIQGVPVKKGIACTECHHSCVEKTPMKNHFTAKHQGMKWSENIERCDVQMPFQGRLKKYIQIEHVEGQEVEMGAESDWQKMLELEFNETMAERTSSATKGHSDICLSSAFIAKMRWDICVKDKDLPELQNLGKTPVKSDRMFQIILCGRKYIEKCCDTLNGGNMIVRRRLMSAG